jgi:hypothetical protein
MLPTHAAAPPSMPSNRHTHPVARSRGTARERSIPLVSLGTPIIVGMLIVTVHLGGIALLNFESARHAWHEKELRRLQQQNEQLRVQLNMLTSEPEVRRWAEAQGMVRAESQNALIVPVSVVNPPSPHPSPPLLRGERVQRVGGFKNRQQGEIPQIQVQATPQGRSNPPSPHPSPPLLRGERVQGVGGSNERNPEILQNLNQRVR